MTKRFNPRPAKPIICYYHKCFETTCVRSSFSQPTASLGTRHETRNRRLVHVARSALPFRAHIHAISMLLISILRRASWVWLVYFYTYMRIANAHSSMARIALWTAAETFSNKFTRIHVHEFSFKFNLPLNNLYFMLCFGGGDDNIERVDGGGDGTEFPKLRFPTEK